MNRLQLVKLDSSKSSIFSYESKFDSSIQSIQEETPISRYNNNISSKSNKLEAAFNIINSNLGASVLAIPFGMKYCGLGYGILLLALTSLIMIYGVKKLIKVSNLIDKPDLYYADLVDIVFGKNYARMTQLLLSSLSFGACISYLIFFNKFFEEAFLFFGITLKDYEIIIVSTIFLLPLVFIKNFHLLNKVSAAAAGMLLLSMFYILYYDQKKLASTQHYASFTDTQTQSVGLKYFDITGIPNFLGVALFCTEGIACVFHVKQSMKKPSNFYPLFSTLISIITLFFILFGTVSLITFRYSIKEIVLLNIPYDSVGSFLAKISFAFGLLLGYPVQAFPIYTVVEKWLLKKKLQKNHNSSQFMTQQQVDNKEQLKIYICRIMVMFSVFLVSYLVPQFVGLLNFIGSISGILVQFIIPIFIYHRIFDEIPLKVKILDYSIIIISFIALIICGYFSAMNLIKSS